MGDLFDHIPPEHEPLASRMRPRTLDEYSGQDHIVGKGRLLRRAIAADQLTSVIFYGPPGTGKTTLARVIANHTSSNFITLNAVLTGVADIRKAISMAEDQKKLYGKKTILFVDEVHRWNKSQQDALLPWVENGTIILIGATTENPFFEVNKALVSRSRVFQLKTLQSEDLYKIAQQALNDVERGYGHYKVEFEKGALEHLIDTANGDARSLLNALELAVETTPEKWYPEKRIPEWGSTIYISLETAEQSIQKKVVLYDKDGDYHYDIISAFIKSLRGRDPDAACYWLARMVKAGEDPHFIFRRMLISACEDTGLADPNAISVVNSCAQAFDRVGLPEGRYFLAHAALYLSTAPKSNSSMAFFDALHSVEQEDAQVPNHLKDSSRDAEGFGHGSGYMYPHSYRDHWVAQQYLPTPLVGRVFYTPTTQGYEAKIRDEVLSRRELQIATLLKAEEDESDKNENKIPEWWMNEHFNTQEQSEENLTFTPQDSKKEQIISKTEKIFRSRIDSNKAQVYSQLKKEMTEEANLLRHHRVLVYHCDDGLILFDAMRKCPEGLVCGICKNENTKNILTQYAATLDDLDKPLLIVQEKANGISSSQFWKDVKKISDTKFDRVFFRDEITTEKDIDEIIQIVRDLFNGKEKNKSDVQYGEEKFSEEQKTSYNEEMLSEDAKIIFSQKVLCESQKLSSLIKEEINPIPNKNIKALERFSEAENKFYSNKNNPIFSWDENTIKTKFISGALNIKIKKENITEKRKITKEMLSSWFNEKSTYGSCIINEIGKDDFLNIYNLLEENCEKRIFNWHSQNLIFTVTNVNKKTALTK